MRFDELQATIDDKIDKALHAERNKMQAMVTKMDMDWLQRAQGLADTLEWIRVYGNVGELTIKFIDKALQQFKDGKGKEVEPPMSADFIASAALVGICADKNCPYCFGTGQIKIESQTTGQIGYATHYANGGITKPD